MDDVVAASESTLSGRKLRILQVSNADLGGGAEAVARNLHTGYRRRGHDARLAVGAKWGEDPNVVRIPRSDARRFGGSVRSKIDALIERYLGQVLGPDMRAASLDLLLRGAAADHFFGREDFKFPGSHRLLELVPSKPDVLHMHNLHGLYFDLRELPGLSQRLPTVLTLHDAWLLSGHCAHSLGCDRWLTGCGKCPDLTIDPAVRRDATAFNWTRKAAIYQQSKLYIATPSEWLMRKVQRSMLAPAIVDARVIRYGIDLELFHPGSQRDARSALGLPQDAQILLTVGNRLQDSPFKDYRTLREGMVILGHTAKHSKIVLIGVGGRAETERIGNVEIRISPFNSTAPMANYYRAADVYVHSARADTFPMVVAEALACGTPVVATSAGGIPEMLRALGTEHEPDTATGSLVRPGDGAALAAATSVLLENEGLRHQLGGNATRYAAVRFDPNAQLDAYLSWYDDITK
jgi:glycosyltransferase involved in cell wall biosynthesis